MVFSNSYKAVKYHTEDIHQHIFVVTGGAGFIGSNIVQYLLEHQAKEVRVIDNLSNGLVQNVKTFQQFPNYKFTEGDVCNLQACQQVIHGADYVLHQAALGSVPRSIINPIDTTQANVLGLVNVLEACRISKVKQVVYASSSSVYGDLKAQPKVEEHIGSPISPYALTKQVNEQYADIYRKVYDLSVVGLRYFNVFGPRQNPHSAYAAAIPIFIDSIYNDKPFKIYGDGKQTRDFTFVENAIQANMKALFAKNLKDFIFNIGTGKSIEVLEVVSTIAKILGKDSIYELSEPRKGEVKDSLASVERAKKILNYAPIDDISYGLQKTIEYYLH